VKEKGIETISSRIGFGAFLILQRLLQLLVCYWELGERLGTKTEGSGQSYCFIKSLHQHESIKGFSFCNSLQQ